MDARGHTHVIRMAFFSCLRKMVLVLAVVQLYAASCSCGRLLSTGSSQAGQEIGSWAWRIHQEIASLATPRFLCIPKGASWVEKHEGRHPCAYNATGGYRGVGVAYDLDQGSVADRKSELSEVFADYDAVYNGEECLNNIQITALLTISVKRALDEAAECVKALDNFSCDIQAVLVDLIFAKGRGWLCEQEDFVEKLSAMKWNKAAEALKKTEWCKKDEGRCKDDIARLRAETFPTDSNVVVE